MECRGGFGFSVKRTLRGRLWAVRININSIAPGARTASGSEPTQPVAAHASEIPHWAS